MTQIKPWIEESHPKLWAEWNRAVTKSDKAVVQTAARLAYGKHSRSLINPDLEKEKGYLRTKKKEILGRRNNSGLMNRILPAFQELGNEAHVKTTQGLIDKLSVRGYTLTQADIDLYKSLSNDLVELRREAAVKRFRPPYGLTDTELKNFHKEIWEFEENKRAFNQRLRQLVDDGIISEEKFRKFQLSPGHGFSAKNFTEFQAEVNNLFAETFKHNQAAGTGLTPAQVRDRVERLLLGQGMGIDLDTRHKINEFAKLAENKGVNPNFIYKKEELSKPKSFDMRKLLRYFTGYGFEGEHGLHGIRNFPPAKTINPASQQKLAIQLASQANKAGILGKVPRLGPVLTALGLTGAATAAAIKSAQAQEGPSILDPVEDFSNVMPSKSGWFGRVAPTGSREAEKYIDKRQARLDEERRPLTESELQAQQNRAAVGGFLSRYGPMFTPIISALLPPPDSDVAYSRGGEGSEQGWRRRLLDPTWRY